LVRGNWQRLPDVSRCRLNPATTTAIRMAAGLLIVGPSDGLPDPARHSISMTRPGSSSATFGSFRARTS
jgi:hypothetical protein